MLIKILFKNLFRHPLRTVLTILGIAVAICAFAFLRTTVTAWYAGVEASVANRLVIRNAISIIFPLPYSYKERVMRMPHVTHATYANWFQGTYISERNFFAQFAVESETYFDVYPEYKITPEELKAFQTERNACIVGQKIAEKFNWKVGDSIRMLGTIYPGDWDFVIRGIYTSDRPNVDLTQFFFNWKYLNESIAKTTPGRNGEIGIILLRIDDPNLAPSVSDMIDKEFANSSAETLTETESAFQASFVAMSGTIISGLKVISGVIIVIVLLVLANTMAMSIRERMSEYAVLKTLGFESGFIVLLIGGEALLIAAVGGLVGLGIAYPLTKAFGKAMSSLFTYGFDITPGTIALGGLSILIVAIVSAFFPTANVLRTRIVDGLRHIG